MAGAPRVAPPLGRGSTLAKPERLWAVRLALFLGCMGVYLAPPAEFLGNDTVPSVLTATSLARSGDADLDELEPVIRGNRRDLPYWVVPTVDGHLVSRFGIGAPLVALPVFGPALLVKGAIDERAALLLGRLVAALCVSAATVLLHASARRIGATARVALAVAGLYALGTSALSLSSQALWQHGPAQLALTLGAYLLIRATAAPGTAGAPSPRSTPWLLAGAGASFSLVVLCRPPDAIFALAAGVAVLVRFRRRTSNVAAFVVGALPLALALLSFNDRHFGSPFSIGQTHVVTGRDALPHASYWDTPFFTGLAGLLVSPSRGLFVYTPAFLLLLWRPRRTFEQLPLAVRALLVGAIALVLVMARYYGWYGGYCFGYRMIADATPVLALALVPGLASLSRRGWAAFGALAAASVVIHAAGALNYSPGDWDSHPDLDAHADRLWSVRDGQLVHVFTRRKTHVEP